MITSNRVAKSSARVDEPLSVEVTFDATHAAQVIAACAALGLVDNLSDGIAALTLAAISLVS